MTGTDMDPIYTEEVEHTTASKRRATGSRKTVKKGDLNKMTQKSEQLVLGS